MTMQLSDANIRSTRYYIAETTVQCMSCGKSTPVLALGVPAPHDILIEEEWQHVDAVALLFNVTALPEGVRCRLARAPSFFRPGPRTDDSDACWTNHCEHCGATVSDDRLHCEPGGFMPGSADEAKTISLHAIHEPFQAATGGYAPDPEFFAHMRKCSPDP
jgi:hypothetical protein